MVEGLRAAAHRRVRNAWFAARIPLSRSTICVRALSWRPNGPRDHRIRGRTEALIDGFPRSGNTTAVYAFWRGNPEVPLAHHLHAPAEVKRAVDRGLPALVLVREPAAAISSLILYQGGVMRPRLGVAAYIAFHRDTLPLANGFAVCTFDQLLADIGLPAKILNRRFGTSFLELEIRQDAAAEIRRAIAHTQLGRGDPERKWSVPSDKRKGLRDEVVEAVRAEPAFTEAEELFASFAALAQEPFA